MVVVLSAPEQVRPRFDRLRECIKCNCASDSHHLIALKRYLTHCGSRRMRSYAAGCSALTINGYGFNAGAKSDNSDAWRSPCFAITMERYCATLRSALFITLMTVNKNTGKRRDRSRH